jgi:hypothetical protein
LQCRIETAHRAIDEAVNLIGSAEKLAPALPFRDHLFRLEDVLRKPGSRAALTLLGVAPARFHCCGVRRQAEIEAELTGAALAEHHGVHQRAGDGAAFVRKRDSDPGCLSDRLGFAEDDIENRAVDGTVGRVEQYRTNQRCRLAKAIDAAFALLMAGRIPRQVVMNDRVEKSLEIDAFRETIGGHQQPLRSPAHCFDALSALLRGQLARNHTDLELRERLLKRLQQPRSNMLRGGDEAAEHHRIGALSDNRLEQLQQRVKFGIVRLGQVFRLRDERGQGIAFADAGSRLDIHCIGFVGIVIEHLFLEPIRFSGEAVPQRAYRGRRRRADTAHERQSAPECEPASILLRTCPLYDPETVVEDGVVKQFMGIAQVVRMLRGLVLRKHTFLTPVAARNIDAAALDEMAG